MGAIEIMKTFDIDNLPDLDVCVLGALELFAKQGTPKLDLGAFKKPLIVGSGNAALTGQILFEEYDAVFADEGTYQQKLDAVNDIDGAVLISASGAKHAPIIAKELKKRKIPLTLLTCNKEAPAKEHSSKTFVFPKQREPYTYNTSTYLGMILGKTKEDPKRILEFIKKKIDPEIPDNLDDYNAFFFILPVEFDNNRGMIEIKFNELFGPMINGRIFTPEQTKHAKTVVPSDKELFVSFGYKNDSFGKNRLNLPMPKGAGHGAMLAIGYYLVGKIQKHNKPYFKDNIVRYCRETSKQFGSNINPIVE